ncbi:MAG: hypothetical protein KA974_04710 [Saprospiraceae bacterium]|nr:hypothetical protein [Saprospiraceae bacterium]MBP7699239.1 hypothetical protein [Saprospiraceae bacterium]
MKEKKFIEDLQKSLETPRDIPFDDANWKKLAAKLPPTMLPVKPVAKTVNWWAIAATTLLLTTAGLAFQYAKINRQLSNEIEKNVTLTQKNIQLAETKIFTPTQEEVVTEASVSTPVTEGNTKSLIIDNQSIINNKKDLEKNNNFTNNIVYSEIISTSSEQKDEQIIKDNEHVAQQSISTQQQNNIVESENKLSAISEIVTLKILQPTTILANQNCVSLEKMMPKIQANQNSHNIFKRLNDVWVETSTSIGSTTQFGKNYGAGLTVNVYKNFKFKVGALSQTITNIEEGEKQDTSGHPTRPNHGGHGQQPHHPQDRFKKAVVTNNSVAIPVSVAWYPKIGQRTFRPYVVVGINFVQSQNNSLTETFQPHTSQDDDYSITETFVEKTWTKTATTALGFEGRLFKNFAVYFQGQYSHPLQTNQIVQEETAFNLTGGVKYLF